MCVNEMSLTEHFWLLFFFHYKIQKLKAVIFSSTLEERQLFINLYLLISVSIIRSVKKSVLQIQREGMKKKSRITNPTSKVQEANKKKNKSPTF